MAGELAERSCGQSGNKVVGVYYGLEYHHASHATLPSYVERVIVNLKNILGHQTIVLHIKNNCLGENKQLFVEGSLVAGTPVKTESLTAVKVLSARFEHCIVGNRQLLFNDFEDHMNNDSFCDYRNLELIGSLKTV
jgi:calcineurin-like phosphoesterase family protein